MHPHNAKDYSDEFEQRLDTIMKHPKCVAWGEIGLDYHYKFSSPEVNAFHIALFFSCLKIHRRVGCACMYTCMILGCVCVCVCVL